MKRLFATLLALGLVLLTSLALAQGSEADKATARELSFEAQQALQAKDYGKAADLFGRAEKLYHAPTLLVGLARAYVGLGKFVEAREAYNRVIREDAGATTAAFKKAVEDAKNEVAGLESKIGWVTITVKGANAPNVTIDDEAVAAASLGVKRAVNPGSHRVKASAEGAEAVEESFEVAAGGSEEVTLELHVTAQAGGADDGPTPAGGDTVSGDGDGGSTLTTVGFVAIGVGAAGLIVGAVTGGLAMKKRNELAPNCPDYECPPEQQDNLNSFRTLGTVSTVGFVVGGVVAAAGIALVVVGMTSGDGESSADAALLLGPGYAGAKLRF